MALLPILFLILEWNSELSTYPVLELTSKLLDVLDEQRQDLGTESGESETEETLFELHLKQV